ncbi:MAG: hypothetical protein IJC88_01175 [Oscillospiraceae bacterium]|nr:hypothetical protein [Oscillospiraceae bacterium]
MIVSENKKPPLEEFKALMAKTDATLNAEAKGREAYYKGRNGTQLEEDVYDALARCAIHTPFEGTIQLVSGASFPDIVANRFYGVEVKSTNKNHWKSIGSSILESTRDQNVERIFLTFGKLGAPIAFKSRPYEECLSGISVTHYPRYQIDMELGVGETIFDKMGIAYDELRRLENPVTPVSKYYKSQLKPGESLWWAAEENPEDIVAPPTIRLWSSLSKEEKDEYRARGYALFPEVLTSKYNRYAVWLVSNCSIVDPHIRDQFSSGGKVSLVTINGHFERVPAAFGKIHTHRELIAETIMTANPATLLEYWQVDALSENRIEQWCQIVASKVDIGTHNVYHLLTDIFGMSPRH